MRIETTTLPGVLVLQPKCFRDDRGYFLETWQSLRYAETGITLPFVQDNVSHSKRGVLRGLHFQNPQAQGKLVSVLYGEVFDVAVDVRAGSATFGNWFGLLLSSENHTQLWVPPGFAHGFCVTSDNAVFAYKCTDFYSPQGECSLRWNDPDVGIKWPEGAKILAPKDDSAPLLRDISVDRLDFRVDTSQ
jgi:dTDP-4-dehydrorhamnose 3,5-epimerase